MPKYAVNQMQMLRSLSGAMRITDIVDYLLWLERKFLEDYYDTFLKKLIRVNMQ